MSDPLLTIRNNHAPTCGDPPIVNNTKDCYVGYFQNMHGEQWIFTYDRPTKAAALRGGDIGWNSPQVVRDGVALGLMLDPGEAAWLRACWNAAVGK